MTSLVLIGGGKVDPSLQDKIDAASQVQVLATNQARINRNDENERSYSLPKRRTAAARRMVWEGIAADMQNLIAEWTRQKEESEAYVDERTDVPSGSE